MCGFRSYTFSCDRQRVHTASRSGLLQLHSRNRVHLLSDCSGGSGMGLEGILSFLSAALFMISVAPHLRQGKGKQAEKGVECEAGRVSLSCAPMTGSGCAGARPSPGWGPAGPAVGAPPSSPTLPYLLLRRPAPPLSLGGAFCWRWLFPLWFVETVLLMGLVRL